MMETGWSVIMLEHLSASQWFIVRPKQNHWSGGRCWTSLPLCPKISKVWTLCKKGQIMSNLDIRSLTCWPQDGSPWTYALSLAGLLGSMAGEPQRSQMAKSLDDIAMAVWQTHETWCNHVMSFQFRQDAKPGIGIATKWLWYAVCSNASPVARVAFEASDPL